MFLSVFLLTLSFDARVCRWWRRDGLAVVLTMGESLPSLSSKGCNGWGEWLFWLGEKFAFLLRTVFFTFAALLLMLLWMEVDGTKVFWQGVDEGGGIIIVEKSHDLGDKRDKRLWWGMELGGSRFPFEMVSGGDCWESGEEFLILPIESDSVADATESSALKRDSPSVFAPIAWSAISEMKKK